MARTLEQRRRKNYLRKCPARERWLARKMHNILWFYGRRLVEKRNRKFRDLFLHGEHFETPTGETIDPARVKIPGARL